MQLLVTHVVANEPPMPARPTPAAVHAAGFGKDKYRVTLVPSGH